MTIFARLVMSLIVLPIGGCGSYEQESVDVIWLDEDLFAEEIQPMLAARCANPSCHGRPERPLSLYSRNGWRVEPGAAYAQEPLERAELAHNFTVCCVLASEGNEPIDSLLLRKPLGDHAATYHGGGTLFAPEDAELRLLLDWVTEGWKREGR